MAINITESAALRMQSFLKTRGRGIGIRLAIKTTGCSGLGYNIEFADILNEDDTVFKTQWVDLIVDTKSLAYIDGSEVDYSKEGLNEGFVFNNPNAKAECGCGESFSV